MRGPKRLLVCALVALVLVLVGCNGTGLGEGGGIDLGPVAPSSFSDPIYQGKLSGQVVFDPGFLHNWLMIQPSSTDKPTRLASLNRDKAFNKSLVVRIHGSKGRHEVKVTEEGTFDFGSVRFGDYVLDVVGRRGALATSSIALEGKSSMKVTIRILGVDLADVDKNQDRQELVVEKEIDYKGEQISYRRIFPVAGDIRTYLPDGSVEYLGNDGYVKIFRADGQIDYRFDPANRFVDEELDPDTGKRRRKDGLSPSSRRPSLPKDPLMAKVTGQGKAPLILSATCRALGRGADAVSAGDLVVLEVKTDSNGGPPVSKVTAQIYSHRGSPHTITLVDDGGSPDMREGWTGMQSSLDREKGDGVFTAALPLDPFAYRHLSASQILIKATNERLLTGRATSLHLYWPPPTPRPPAPGIVPGLIGFAGLNYGNGPSGRTFTAEVRLKAPSPRLLTGTVYGPDGFKRLLTPVGEMGEEEEEGARPAIVTLRSTAAPLVSQGLYVIVLSDPTGDVFYASVLVGPDEIAGRDIDTETDKN